MSEPILDVAVVDELQETLGGDPAILEELIGTFIDDAAELVASAKSTAFDDADGFRRAVHSLKTTSATFGASKLSSMCRHLEIGAREGATVQPEDLDALAAASQEATSALQRLTNGN